jgi:crotonobetainyl-CoA:carnitine CoA-transferase CaiB-like acyl-CoA transferase
VKTSSPAGALDGIKVVELGEMVSAPFCARLFADYGADVVKVERPEGDVARRWGPFPADEPHWREERAVFLSQHEQARRDSRRHERAGATCSFAWRRRRRPIENNPPALMRERRLDYASIRDVNPNLVMISITPYGQTGPYSDWIGYDLNAYHLTGASHRYCGRPGEAPLEHGTFAATSTAR